jgi:hypothetical protein
LDYPLKVEHQDRPDFLLTLGGVQFGVECTEAVPPEHRHIEDIREKHYPDALNWGQKFRPGQENFTLDEKRAIARGDLSGGPWMPSTAKENWLAAMKYVIAEKTAKLRKGNYAEGVSTWLLVRDEWPNTIQFYPDQVRTAAEVLRSSLTELLSAPAFQIIYIESANQLLRFQDSYLTIEPVCDLWGRDIGACVL